MLWQELLVDRELTAEKTAAAFADLFGVARAEVAVVESVAALEAAEGVKVLCERGTAGGDFPARLSVYVRDPALEGVEGRPLVERFSRRLGCSCLMSDDSPNPYSMLLVRPDGETRRVYLDTARLDERDEYVVSRPAEEGEET